MSISQPLLASTPIAPSLKKRFLAAFDENFLKSVLRVWFRTVRRLEVAGLENFDAQGVVLMQAAAPLDAAIAFAILPGAPIFVLGRPSRDADATSLLELLGAATLVCDAPLRLRALVRVARAGKTPVFLLPAAPAADGFAEACDAAALLAEKTGARILRLQVERRRTLIPRTTATLFAPADLPASPRLSGRERRRAGGEACRELVRELRFATGDFDRTVIEALADAGRLHGFARLALANATYGRMLARARALAKKLKAFARAGEPVGLLSNDGLAFLALSSLGCVPVLLDARIGADRLCAALAASGAKTVVTSRGVLAGARDTACVAALEAAAQVVYLEDLEDAVTRADLLRASLLRDRPFVRRRARDVAAILFTAGAEGTPKGVALSHRNLLANAAQLAARLDLDENDRLFCALPLCSAFGVAAGLLLPLLCGASVHRADAGAASAARKLGAVRATILVASDRTLAELARRGRAEDFRHLRYAIAAGESVRPETHALWSEKFGVRLLEAYGAAEALTLSTNAPQANRSGTVGRFLPGVETRLEPVDGAGAKLFVRGPNLMLGYLDPASPIGIVRRNGWLDTGDVVSVDEDGFVSIDGRAARYAQIGGRLASLADVEALAKRLWPNALSVATIEADTRKGEHILLLTERRTATRAEFAAFVKARNASELLIPFDIVAVAQLPRLADGRPDFAGVTELARDRVRLAPVAPRAPNGLGRIDGDKLPLG
ncbi:MAG TPA: AMP-binding protein [Methylocystis sp.]|nr:AMP-binding protein [Methylocystis sp.]